MSQHIWVSARERAAALTCALRAHTQWLLFRVCYRDEQPLTNDRNNNNTHTNTHTRVLGGKGGAYKGHALRARNMKTRAVFFLGRAARVPPPAPRPFPFPPRPCPPPRIMSDVRVLEAASKEKRCHGRGRLLRGHRQSIRVQQSGGANVSDQSSPSKRPRCIFAT